jgi:hypothetical protein
MNMSMLAEFLSDVMIPQHVDIQNVPDVELPAHWYEFEEALGTYKNEYKEKLNLFRLREQELVNLNGDLTILQNAASVIGTDDTKSDMDDIIKRFKETHEIEKLTRELTELKGELRAMETVLMNTNARKYSQFTCSICMERMVDTFIDPCGHLACETCLMRTRSNACPMCRTTVQATRHMFPTMA